MTDPGNVARAISTNAGGGTAPAAGSARAGPRPNGPVILVADDEMSVRELCLRLVEHLGYRSLGAADGVEAVRVFEAHRHEIACVILDVTMPRMDGYATFVELKRLVPAVRVVLSSGYSESEATLRFKAQGLAGFVQKPYRLAQLKAALESALSGGEPRSGGGEAAGSGAGA